MSSGWFTAKFLKSCMSMFVKVVEMVEMASIKNRQNWW